MDDSADPAPLDLREKSDRCAPLPDERHLKGRDEAFFHAWRPQKASSLAEGWRSEGQDGVERLIRRDVWRAARALMKPY